MELKDRKPLVSVIMAVYNAEETLHEAIDSIIAQTYQNWEFVICDDCSTDNTYSIIQEYSEKFPGKFIIIRNEQNSKLAYSLNHCLEYCKGEYIARMDGDDISVPERFQNQVDFLNKHPDFAVVGTAMTPFDENGERRPRTKKGYPVATDLRYSPVFNHATIMMRKSCYDALNGYLVSPMTLRTQDYELWFRFFKAGFKGYNMPEPLYKVRESINDMKRRTWKMRIQAVKIRWYGFRLNNFPLHYYVFVLKPLLTGLLPQKIHFSLFKK